MYRGNGISVCSDDRLGRATANDAEVNGSGPREPATLSKMDQITVHILPAIKGRNPKIFDPYSNAQFVMGGMEDSCGKGVLEDPQGIRVLPDSEHKLGPGHYLYILVGPGRTPNLHLYLGKQGQGLKAREYHTQREDTVISVLEAAMRVGALMVTAPPQSGKTSLLQLLDKAALKSNLFADIYYVNIAENNNSLKHGLDQYKKSWETLFEAEAADGSCKMNLLLLDEAQLLFGRDDPFWSGIKSLLMGPQPCQRIPSLRVILACSYICSPSAFAEGLLLIWRPSCTVTLDSEVSLKRLQLSKPEYHELLQNFRMLKCPDALFKKQVRKALYHDTAGQAGLVTALLDHTLDQLQNKPFKAGQFDETLGACMQPDKLQSSVLASFWSFLQETAATCRMTRTVLKRLLKKECGAKGVNQVESWDVWGAARILYHRGLLARRDIDGVVHLGFISPLHRRVCKLVDIKGESHSEPSACS